MKKFKIFSLLVMSLVLATGLYSCKDDDEVTVNLVGPLQVSLKSVTDGQRKPNKQLCDTIKYTVNQVISSNLRTDTVPVNSQTINDRSLAFARSIEQAFSNGSELVPEGITMTVTFELGIGMEMTRQCIFKLTNKDFKFEYPGVIRIIDSYYLMQTSFASGTDSVTFVINSLSADEMGNDIIIKETVTAPTQDFADTIANRVLKNWPIYQIMEDEAIKYYNVDLGLLKAELAAASTLFSDTTDIQIGYCLSYGPAAIIQSTVYNVKKGVVNEVVE